jgi:hypothetical protein
MGCSFRTVLADQVHFERIWIRPLNKKNFVYATLRKQHSLDLKNISYGAGTGSQLLKKSNGTGNDRKW